MLEMLAQLVAQYGYGLFFVAFGLGPVGIPIPNEAMMLLGGSLAGEGTLDPGRIYAYSLAGLIVAYTVSFLVGRLFGHLLMRKLRANERFRRPLAKVDALTARYGAKALLVSCFLPGVRYLMPFVAGATGVPFRRLALFAYTGAMAWILIYFMLGFHWGDEAFELMEGTGMASKIFFLASTLLLYFATRIIVRRRKAKSGLAG